MPLLRIVALVAALPLLAAGQFIGAGSLDSAGDTDVVRTPGFNSKTELPKTRNARPLPAGGILINAGSENAPAIRAQTAQRRRNDSHHAKAGVPRALEPELPDGA